MRDMARFGFWGQHGDGFDVGPLEDFHAPEEFQGLYLVHRASGRGVLAGFMGAIYAVADGDFEGKQALPWLKEQPVRDWLYKGELPNSPDVAKLMRDDPPPF